MIPWALDAADRHLKKPYLVLAQETSPEWLAVWEQAGYGVVAGAGEDVCVSAVIAHPDVYLEPLSSSDLPGLVAHGSYVAAAEVRLPGAAVALRVLSIHASPAEPAAERAKARENLFPRDVEGLIVHPRQVGTSQPWAGAEWDSDRVLATAIHAAIGHELLVAGDFNEARGWDDRHGGTWGHEFFHNAEVAGLMSPLYDENRSPEIPTRWHRRGEEQPLQLDHVLATSPLAERIDQWHVDQGWSDPDIAVYEQGLSDHAPVWFWIEPKWYLRTDHGITFDECCDPFFEELLPADFPTRAATSVHNYEGGSIHFAQDADHAYIIDLTPNTMLDTDDGAGAPKIWTSRFRSATERDRYWEMSRVSPQMDP